MDKRPTPTRSISMVLRVDDWNASQRGQFMTSFSQNMEKLAPTMWKDVLNALPRDVAYKMEDNPGDSPLFRLSFAPGFDGGPLRVSIKATVPPHIHQMFKDHVENEVEKFSADLKDSWMVNTLMPAVGWLVRKSKEERSPDTILKFLIDDERERLEAKIPDSSTSYWMGHAASSFLKIILRSTSDAVEEMDLPAPIAPLLLEGNGKVVEVGLENITEIITAPPRPTGSVKIKV